MKGWKVVVVVRSGEASGIAKVRSWVARTPTVTGSPWRATIEVGPAA